MLDPGGVINPSDLDIQEGYDLLQNPGQNLGKFVPKIPILCVFEIK